MTDTQIRRAMGKLWDKMIEGDGYQPWGYDLRTLKITKPEYVKAMYRLKAMLSTKRP
jgi:hypothetical protein